MLHPVYLEPSDLPAQIRHLHSKGHIRVEPILQIAIPADAGTWSGGTRRVFSAVELATGRTVSITDTFSAPWDARRTCQTINLKPGYAIVETGSFCGKPAGLHLYIHPADAAPMLPAPPVALSDHGKVLLHFTCSLKSAYRADECARYGMGAAEIAAAKAELQRAGYVDARGAVTVKGRNARPRDSDLPKRSGF